MIENLLEFLLITVFGIVTFLLAWFMHIQNDDFTPVPSQNYMWHPTMNQLYCLNC